MKDEKNFNVNDNQLDFGADAHLVPPGDPAFDAWIEKVAPTLNAPNAVPRLEMWQAIAAARATSEDAQAGRIPGVTPFRRHWRLMSVIAAALLVGVAIDRAILRKDRRPSDATIASATARPDSSDPARLYRIAAAQTLTQAEALLTAYRASGAPERDSPPGNARQLGRWGREVLSSTRLLMDSPAGNDPQLRALFNDLELVVVQIIQLSGGQLDPSERALIDRALETKELLPRIRTAVPAGVAGVAAASTE